MSIDWEDPISSYYCYIWSDSIKRKSRRLMAIHYYTPIPFISIHNHQWYNTNDSIFSAGVGVINGNRSPRLNCINASVNEALFRLCAVTVVVVAHLIVPRLARPVLKNVNERRKATHPDSRRIIRHSVQERCQLTLAKSVCPAFASIVERDSPRSVHKVHSVV